MQTNGWPVDFLELIGRRLLEDLLARAHLAEGLCETLGLLAWSLEKRVKIATEHSIVPKLFETFMNLNGFLATHRKDANTTTFERINADVKETESLSLQYQVDLQWQEHPGIKRDIEVVEVHSNGAWGPALWSATQTPQYPR